MPRGFEGPLPQPPVPTRPGNSLRDRSLRWFVALTIGITAWRLLLAVAWLLFGPGVGTQNRVAEMFFVLSKAFLGGVFWPVSLAIDGLRNPLGWLLAPW